MTEDLNVLIDKYGVKVIIGVIAVLFLLLMHTVATANIEARECAYKRMEQDITMSWDDAFFLCGGDPRDRRTTNVYAR